MAWTEAISRSSTILRDIAHILTHANKLVDNVTVDPAKNWQIVFPSPIEYGVFIDVADERHVGVADVTLTHAPLTDQEPIVVRHCVSNGSGGFTVNTLTETTQYTVDYALGKINVLVAVAPADEIAVDYSWVQADADNALAHATDRVVLKATTSTSAVPEIDPTYGSGGTSVAKISAYLEIKMPRNLINPETNTADYKDLSGLLRGTDRNRHYLQMRIFDQWDPVTKDVKSGAVVSEWAKLAWFRDFREILSTDAQGLPPATTAKPFFTQTRIAVNLADMPIQLWIRSDNDRVTGVISGDPSIDPDNGIVSFFYLGQIDPVEDTQADVIGNFALVTSSSTLPTAAANAPTAKPIMTFVDATTSTTPIPGTTSPGYVLSYTTDDGESPASFPYMHEFSGTDRRFSIRLRASGIPAEARSIRLYRNTAQKIVIDKTLEKIDNYSILSGLTEYTFPNTLTTYDGIWRVVVQREGKTANSWGVLVPTWGPDYVLPTGGYLITPSQITVSVSEINAVPTVSGFTGRFRVLVTTKIQDPTVRYGDGSSWELIFETTDTSTEFMTDVGLTGDPAFKPYLEGRPNPGVKRDTQGRVVGSYFPTRWGPNTATGVLDIAMLKTKSGAPIQKHHASFVSMGKSVEITALNPSSWTGKVHLSPIWVVHPYDGYRGKLRDVLVVPRKNLVHLDELIVDKTLPTEKHYKFFRVSAPYSIFNSAPYQQVGVAIRMS